MFGYYKGKYAIGIYNKIQEEGDTDSMVEIFDTVQELADYLGKSLQQAYDIARMHFTKGQNDIVIQGKMYELAFINMVD